MPWNNELESLTLYVGENLGEEAMTAAIGRALAAVTKSASQNMDTATVIEGGAVACSDGRLWSLDCYYDALLLELRKLVTPH